LYYILAKRLLEQKPTVLQTSSEFLFSFSAHGVQTITPSKVLCPDEDIYRDAWALIDMDSKVEDPGEMVLNAGSPFFLVVASSPRPSRWHSVEKHRSPADFWLMKPFSLAELIQASVFLYQHFVLLLI
jgi:hypothetical protein